MNHYSRYPSGEDPPGRIGDILIGAEAEAELHRMETSGKLLRFSLFRGHVTSMDFRHPHYPRTTPGMMYWFSASKILRDLCVPSGWQPVCDNGVEKVVSPDRSFGITVVPGNSDTGLEHRIPSCRRPRGRQSERDVQNNTQGDLFGYKPPDPVEKTWYLLHYHLETPDSSELRGELSLPWVMEGGYVVRWYRRIILPVIDLNDEPPHLRIDYDEPSEPETDIVVTKREA